MPKYAVDLMSTLTTTITVEADSEDDAIEKAFDSEAMPGSICAQCTGWGQKFSIDQGEWDTPPSDINEQPVRLAEE